MDVTRAEIEAAFGAELKELTSAAAEGPIVVMDSVALNVVDMVGGIAAESVANSSSERMDCCSASL